MKGVGVKFHTPTNRVGLGGGGGSHAERGGGTCDFFPFCMQVWRRFWPLTRGSYGTRRF